MDGRLSRETLDGSVAVDLGGSVADGVPIPERTTTTDNGALGDGLEAAFDLVSTAIGAFLDALN
jgi:hypothetical protein